MERKFQIKYKAAVRSKLASVLLCFKPRSPQTNDSANRNRNMTKLKRKMIANLYNSIPRLNRFISFHWNCALS